MTEHLHFHFQTHLGKMLPVGLCSPAHNHSVAPAVYWKKSNHLTLSLKFFQNLAPAPFPVWLPSTISVSPRVAASCSHQITPVSASLTQFYLCLLSWESQASQPFFRSTLVSQHLTRSSSHSSLSCCLVFFYILGIHATQWQAIWDHWLHLPDITILPRAASLELYKE